MSDVQVAIDALQNVITHALFEISDEIHKDLGDVGYQVVYCTPLVKTGLSWNYEEQRMRFFALLRMIKKKSPLLPFC